MKNLTNITATNGRVINSMKPVIESVVNEKLETVVKEEIDKTKIHIGVLTKYYPYLDKAEVKVDNKTIICKVLHRMHGSLVDFFTPLGDSAFCEKLKERCIIPRGELECLIADVNDNTKEQLLLGFFLQNDVLYTHPAEMGHYKIVDLAATNEYGLDIGRGTFNVYSNEGVNFTEGLTEAENTTVNYADTNDVYTKSETYDRKHLYTRKQVDDLIKKAIDDLREEILGDDTDDTTD